jgi:phosphotransferase system enzyme I (PtsI)
LGIPAVVGLRDLHRHARTGDQLLVDASDGEVILHPSAETLERYAALSGHSHVAQFFAVTEAVRQEPLRTADGVGILLRANVELPVEYEGVKKFGARGIGLYRSEFLLSQGGQMPSEDEQCAVYIEVAKIAGEDGVMVRLFDLGGDKIGVPLSETERNPALGLRAIRYGLREGKILRTQVSAILRAAARGRLDIVLPMISDVVEVRRAKQIIDEERARLLSQGKETGAIRVGVMIEVPSAVFTAPKIAREVDFFSLGTNDLVQYLLAVDRGNDEVAAYFRSLHPAVLQSISLTLKAAQDASIQSIVCGEMAATPAYVVVLIGLGATDFSMNPSSIPRVRHTVAGVKREDAREIAAACLDCASADDVEELVRTSFRARWPHIFTKQSLPTPKISSMTELFS